jgi:hypothetical protein
MVIVATLYRRPMTIIVSDEESFPIVQWLGRDGEDCDPADAIVVIAGTDEMGWLTIDLDDCEQTWLH